MGRFVFRISQSLESCQLISWNWSLWQLHVGAKLICAESKEFVVGWRLIHQSCRRIFMTQFWLDVFGLTFTNKLMCFHFAYSSRSGISPSLHLYVMRSVQRHFFSFWVCLPPSLAHLHAQLKHMRFQSFNFHANTTIVNQNHHGCHILDR